jgi:hypothetical protein
VLGQVMPAGTSTASSPANKVKPQARLSILILSKTYPSMGLYLAHLTRHAAVWLWRLFLPKATSSWSLLSTFYTKLLVDYSFYVDPTTFKHVWSNHYLFFSTTHNYIIIIFHLLLGVARRTSSLNNRENTDSSNRIS